MLDQPTGTVASSRYDLVAGRFRLLAIDPTATSAQIEQAYAAARARTPAMDQALIDARNSILDPAQRLLCELAYPIDSSDEQVTAFYSALSDSGPVSELLPAANTLPPLSRANLLAHLAARQAANANNLLALVDAHAAIDAATIFEILKDRRNRAGFPMPSLVDIGQGLRQLLILHSEAAIAAYGTIEEAAQPLFDCTDQLLSSGDRYRIEALSALLDAHRLSLAHDNGTTYDVDAAFEAVRERPDTLSIQQFEQALASLILPMAPLILLDIHQKRPHGEIDRIVTGARDLLADLAARGDHETALKTAAICRKAFRRLPGYVEPFEEAETALRQLSLEAVIKPLEDLIKGFEREPTLLTASIQKKGFGKGSSGQARILWEAFCTAATATFTTELNERPWMLIRDFAFDLDALPKSGTAATRMISDLLRPGEAPLAPPLILELLRNDLNTLETRNGLATTGRIRTIPYARTIVFLILGSVVMLSAFLAYRYLNPHASLFAVSAPQPVSKEELEAIPPASQGEHFKRDFVRYCHFQEERLRVIKQHVHGPQDIQAFNMLANDYNLRCSNFYYLDEDLKIVTEEVKARKQILEADAMRILSTWPWHAAPGNAMTPAAK